MTNLKEFVKNFRYSGDGLMIDKIKVLIEQGADLNAKNETSGLTLLTKASFDNYIDSVNFLLEHDVDVNGRDWEGKTALHLAVLNDNIEIARALVSHGAEVNVEDEDGLTPFHFVDTIEMINLLLEHGANVEYCADILILRMSNDIDMKGIGFEMVKYLLENNIVSAKYIPPNRCSALHHVVKNEDFEMTKLLLEHGADPDLVDIDGNSPISLAKDNEYADIFKILKKYSQEKFKQSENDKLTEEYIETFEGQL